MAHVKLSAGADITLLSEEEMSGHVERLSHVFEKMTRGQEDETITRSAAPFKTNTTGSTAKLAGGGGLVYTVPVGFDAFVTRLSVDYEGSTAKTQVSCDLRGVADQNTPAALRILNNLVPSIYEASKSHAPLFRGGQNLIVCLQTGPHTTTIYCTVQVILTRRKAIHTDTLA